MKHRSTYVAATRARHAADARRMAAITVVWLAIAVCALVAVYFGILGFVSIYDYAHPAVDFNSLPSP